MRPAICSLNLAHDMEPVIHAYLANSENNEIILCDKIYSEFIMISGFKHSGKDKTIWSFLRLIMYNFMLGKI